MEYIFRNSPREELTTVFLCDYDFRLYRGGNEEVISYAMIVSVRITRSEHTYRIHIHADGHRPIVISNTSFLANKNPVEQSQSYALFVGVLHHHLKEKGQAVFTAGGNMKKILQWASVSSILSLIISISADHLGYSLINPYLQALILTVAATILVMTFGSGSLPKSYQPANIPVQYLP